MYDAWLADTKTGKFSVLMFLEGSSKGRESSFQVLRNYTVRSLKRKFPVTAAYASTLRNGFLSKKEYFDHIDWMEAAIRIQWNDILNCRRAIVRRQSRASPRVVRSDIIGQQDSPLTVGISTGFRRTLPHNVAIDLCSLGYVGCGGASIVMEAEFDHGEGTMFVIKFFVRPLDADSDMEHELICESELHGGQVIANYAMTTEIRGSSLLEALEKEVASGNDLLSDEEYTYYENVLDPSTVYRGIVMERLNNGTLFDLLDAVHQPDEPNPLSRTVLLMMTQEVVLAVR